MYLRILLLGTHIHKMNKNLLITIIILVAFILASGVSNKDLTYFQYKGVVSDTVNSVTPATFRILPYDNLYIRMVTPDPRWPEMFNTLPTKTYSVTVTEQNADLISFTVDSFGAIHIPSTGKIQMAEKKIETITADVEAALDNYITDTSVTVKLQST